MFSDIDLLSGDVQWLVDERQEDMLQVVYPNNYILDMGWYTTVNKYLIYIVKNFEWSIPVAKYSAESEEDIKRLLSEVIKKFEMLSQR